jgi:hypothetical protein
MDVADLSTLRGLTIMTSRFHHFCVMLALAAGTVLASGTSHHAFADDDLRLDEAWKDAIEEHEGVVTPQQQAALVDLAYQSAVARVCDAISLDVPKYAKAVNDIVAPGAENLTPEQNLERQTNILLSLGTFHGLFLAEGNANKDKFCADAVAAKNDSEVPHNWQ